MSAWPLAAFPGGTRAVAGPCGPVAHSGSLVLPGSLLLSTPVSLCLSVALLASLGLRPCASPASKVQCLSSPEALWVSGPVLLRVSGPRAPNCLVLSCLVLVGLVKVLLCVRACARGVWTLSQAACLKKSLLAFVCL